jgi:hypothetical protein
MTDNTLPQFTPAETVPVAAPHQMPPTGNRREPHRLLAAALRQHTAVDNPEPHLRWMDRLCADYSGGVWNFYTLSNGGAFMAPESEGDETWSLFNDMNGNSAAMSAEAAGIAVCLMTYSHHACRTESDAMTEHYYRLRDYALSHAECNAIMHIID